MKISEMKKLILEIVEDHSGGLKFTELITKLYEAHESKQIELITPEFTEEIIRKMPELKILEFTYKTLKREKMFVYTP